MTALFKYLLVTLSGSCVTDLDEAPVLKVEDVDQDVGQEKSRNIPQIITTPEPEFALHADVTLLQLR